MLEANKIDYTIYHKDYYKSHKAEYVQFVKCECCNVFIKAFSLNKHLKGKRHIFNTLTEEEKLEILKQKNYEVSKN